MKKKKAFIIGISGQDGSYLSKYLIKKNYLVFGYTRSLKKKNLRNLKVLKTINKIKLRKYSDLKPNIIYKDLLNIKPSEIYFFAGQSSVNYSFKNPIETYKSNVNVLFDILELLRKNKLSKIKLYNSSSTDCFGKSKNFFNNEKDLFNPQSPYAIAKSFSFWLVKYYRENYKLHSKSGILSNHESPLRTENFVLKRIINFAKNHKNNNLNLGNIEVHRDWGWAPEFIEAIYKINMAKIPKDYLVGTGKITSLKSIVNKIFKKFNIKRKFLKTNSIESLRPNDVKKIGTNPKKIYKELQWKSRTNIDQLIGKMILNEYY